MIRKHHTPHIEPVILYGWHPVAEALANPKRHIRQILATENAARKLEERFGALSVPLTLVRPREIDRLLTPDAVHQGLYAEADPLPSPSFKELPPEALVLVLDQITDPHNVGAIIRTAAAFAVDAIVTTARHSPAATGVLAKSASGGLEHVPIIVVRNLVAGLEDLKATGFTCLGLDSEGEAPLDLTPRPRPLALVLGAEGKGLRPSTRAACTTIARLDMPGVIKSLNVSNAAAIALFAVSGRA